MQTRCNTKVNFVAPRTFLSLQNKEKKKLNTTVQCSFTAQQQPHSFRNKQRQYTDLVYISSPV